MAFISQRVTKLLLFIGGYLIFLIVGSSIFSAIEGPEEFKRVQALRTMRYKFLQENKCVHGKLK